MFYNFKTVQNHNRSDTCKEQENTIVFINNLSELFTEHTQPKSNLIFNCMEHQYQQKHPKNPMRLRARVEISSISHEK